MLIDIDVSDRWVGVGDRRLKNSVLVLEWIPEAWKVILKKRVGVMFDQLMKGCGDSSCSNPNCASCPSSVKPKDNNEAGARAMQLVRPHSGFSDVSLSAIFCPSSLRKLKEAQIDPTGTKYLSSLTLIFQ